MIYNEYFASMNTGSGFCSFFDKIFPPSQLQALYIIKGGSGTGKSTIMKNIACHFKEKGRSVEVFLCSADINSFDGILIDSKVAVIDGTSPHTTDPVYPGAVDLIVDLSDSWNEKILQNEKDEIIDCVSRKSESYKEAYGFLNAGCRIKKEITHLAERNFNYKKMNGAINRFFKQNNLKGKGFKKSVRLVSTVGADGETTLETFENLSDKICCVSNAHGCENIFFDAFYKKIKECELNCVVSYSHTDANQINALYLPEIKTCVVKSRGKENTYNSKYKIFNMERFIDKNVISQNRSKLRFLKKCSDALTSEAIKSFRNAKGEHEKLEKIYSAAVDFKKVGEKELMLIDKIEKLLS